MIKRNLQTKKAIIAIVALTVFMGGQSFAQRKGIPVSGKILNGSQNSVPVKMGMVFFPELNIKSRCDADGNYSATVPSDGIYLVTVTSPGLKMMKGKVDVRGATIKDFIMYKPSVKGEVTVTNNRDIQKISRHTMTLKQLKEVPASFGDSLNALTSLPNVMRTDGLFGSMIIRGADPVMNGYFVDGIPIYNPMHFGGIHSVINNNLMKEIDLYSSSFPVNFGDSQAAVININTVDEVERTGGYADMGLISSAALIQKPIEEEYIDENGITKKRNKGYVIVSGRLGYLTLFFKAFGTLYTKIFGGDAPDSLPYYGDYQFKTKYFFTPEHSLTFLAFGSYDFIDVKMPEDAVGDKGDPLWIGAQYRNNNYSHGQGLTYSFSPSGAFKNNVLLYNSLMVSQQKLAIEKSPQPDLAKGVNVKSKPLIAGCKESFSLDLLKDHVQLRGGADLTFYYFSLSGTTFEMVDQIDVDLDPAKNQLDVIKLNKNIKNFSAAAFGEMKINAGKLEFVPGIRSSHLSRIHQSMVDPRGRISYEFPSETTISAAGGKYSYTVQTSPSFFAILPNLASADYLKPQYAYHSSAGIEQKIGDFSVKAEGFYNIFENIVTAETWSDNGITRNYKNCAKMKSMGAELMLKLDQKENTNGVFGWVSYSIDKSRYKTGAKVLDPENYDKWIDSSYEMVHTLKLVLGYVMNRHSISGRFQYNTATPYTPIIGSELTYKSDGSVYVGPKGYNRYSPVYGKTNSARLGPEHRLDLRYTYKENYEQGYFSWYLEVINVTNYVGEVVEWDYRNPYSAKNPEKKKDSDALNILPNFGIEIKF